MFPIHVSIGLFDFCGQILQRVPSGFSKNYCGGIKIRYIQSFKRQKWKGTINSHYPHSTVSRVIPISQCDTNILNIGLHILQNLPHTDFEPSSEKSKFLHFTYKEPEIRTSPSGIGGWEHSSLVQESIVHFPSFHSESLTSYFKSAE